MFDTLYLCSFAPLLHGKVERVDSSYYFIMTHQPMLFLQKVDAFLSS